MHKNENEVHEKSFFIHMLVHALVQLKKSIVFYVEETK